MPETLSIDLPDEASTLQLGAVLAGLPAINGKIFLHGELGAGKTTLVRGFLRALGHEGAVKSPTYTLMEPYELGGRAVYHLDIYRLGAAEELEYLGVRELFITGNTLLIEWPERAAGTMGEPDLEISLEYQGNARRASLRSRHPEILSEIAHVTSAPTNT